MTIAFLSGNAKSEGATSNGAKVSELVAFGIQCPDLVAYGELLSKPDAESLEASSASHLVAQVQHEMHVLDGHH